MSCQREISANRPRSQPAGWNCCSVHCPLRSGAFKPYIYTGTSGSKNHMQFPALLAITCKICRVLSTIVQVMEACTLYQIDSEIIKVLHEEFVRFLFLSMEVIEASLILCWECQQQNNRKTAISGLRSGYSCVVMSGPAPSCIEDSEVAVMCPATYEHLCEQGLYTVIIACMLLPLWEPILLVVIRRIARSSSTETACRFSTTF